jgi:hypothetical protein
MNWRLVEGPVPDRRPPRIAFHPREKTSFVDWPDGALVFVKQP